MNLAFDRRNDPNHPEWMQSNLRDPSSPDSWVNTDFRRRGMQLGTMTGLLHGTASTMAGRPGPARAPWQNVAGNVGAGLNKAHTSVNNFGVGTFDPIMSGATYPFHAVWNSRVGRPGVRSTPFFQGGAARTNSQLAGRALGVGTLGLGALGGAYGMATNHARNTVQEGAGRGMMDAAGTIRNALPDMLDEMGPELSQRLQQHLGGGALQSMGRGAMGGVDHMLSMAGMDPTRMSPVQKLAIIGGLGVGGGGLMAGSPLAAGLGGGTALMGLMGGGDMGALNYLHGQGQQGQRGTQPSPYGTRPGESPAVWGSMPARNEQQHQNQILGQ